MRRMTRVKIALAGASVAALSVSGAFAATSTPDGGVTSAVVNKNGHEVNEHAADGQARAAEARAAAEARKAAKPPKAEKPAKPAQATQPATPQQAEDSE